MIKKKNFAGSRTFRSAAAALLVLQLACFSCIHAASNEVTATSSNLFMNSLGQRFVSVPGLNVMFSAWETRLKDYQAYISATQKAWNKPDFAQGEYHPVVNVTWEDAIGFCSWLTAKERKQGIISEKQKYRLPTDAEWSAAVGQGTETGRTPEERMKSQLIWPWGAYWPPQAGDGNYAPELGADSFAETSPVGSSQSNRFGLFDMGGNVWEWCDDWYNQTHVTKVLRGASYRDAHPKDLLATYRFSGTVHLSNDDIGFRIVLEKR